MFSLYRALTGAALIGVSSSFASAASVHARADTCFSSMCVSATVNGSDVQYTLKSTGSTVGWMAVGWGTQMSGSDVVILWPNDDGTITLSQRHASGHIEPSVVDSPTHVATLDSSLSSTSGSTQSYTFTLASGSTGKVNMLYAFSATKPSGSAANSELQEHDSMGTFTLNIDSSSSGGDDNSGSNSGSNGSNSGSNSGSSQNSQPLSIFEKKIVAHGILMTIGFLGLLPLGALIPRLSRTFTNKWFLPHMTIQWFITGPIIVAGFALGVNAFSSLGGGRLDDHMKWGIVLFVLYILQLAVGAFIHWVKPKAPRRRPPQNYFHAILGLLIIALAFYQVRDGFKHEWPKVSGRGEPKGAQVVWYIWVVLIPVLYVAGLTLIPKQYRQEREQRDSHKNGQ